MRYLDSGSRNKSSSLGAWLDEVRSTEVVAQLRWQSGFFGVGGIGHLSEILSNLRDGDATVRVVVGSNDSGTALADVVGLLAIAGAPRENLDVGVARFANAYFHPKVIHFTLSDGSAIAYVGSANLTKSGVSALHVEAGIVLDTRAGDSPTTLQDIAAAVDFWFEESRPGLHVVRGKKDAEELARAGVLSTHEESVLESAVAKELGGAAGPHLVPLVQIPSLPDDRGIPDEVLLEPHETDTTVVQVEVEWSKKLSNSDAQRKTSGHQRGSISLVKGDYKEIDTATFFRDDLFVTAVWVEDHTRTGRVLEKTVIPMLVTIDSLNLGEVHIEITHDPGRESGQGNYSSLLHLGPLQKYFQLEDQSGKKVAISRRNNGTFSLSIGAT